MIGPALRRRFHAQEDEIAQLKTRLKLAYELLRLTAALLERRLNEYELDPPELINAKQYLYAHPEDAKEP